MNTPVRVLLLTAAGLLAGLLTWSLIDLVRLIPIADRIRTLTAQDIKNYRLAGMVWGASLGVFLGVADLLARGTLAQWRRVLGLGLAVGTVAGVVGLNLGMAVFGPLYTEGARTPLAFVGNVIARGLGWAFIGALAGTVDGWRKLSPRVARNGFLGGLLGGVLGGTTFEVVPYLMPGLNPGPAARFLGFVITGAMIGLMISLVQEWFKEAWIRVVVGRNEGREHLIEKEQTRIGRAELADIPLFGDRNIARMHAVLQASPGNGWLLRDTGESAAGTYVNDERLMGERALRSGDRIQIGSKLLVFYEKQVRERTARPSREGVRAAARPTPPAVDRARSGAHLVVTSGPYRGRSIDLLPGQDLWTIGREPSADIPLPEDAKASRNHARIWRDSSGAVTVEDAGSTNGTFVNGQRVSKIALQAGDAILIGASILRYEE